MTDCAEPNNQVSSVQGVESTELVETKHEPLLTCPADDHVFDELFTRTNEEFDGVEDLFETLLDDDSAYGLLEQPQDNAIMSEVWGFG
ncbi:hypothetical protein V6N12_054513 [Hibiscus sabdariffa]|uniref:Uncharacterized protein n=1 Tax=Hibiscus sabdariffa TaxID=183260 RepID=A0ABR2D2G1_9ROSI